MLLVLFHLYREKLNLSKTQNTFLHFRAKICVGKVSILSNIELMMYCDRCSHLGIVHLLYPQFKEKNHHSSSAWTKKPCQDTSRSMPGKAKHSCTRLMSVSACHGRRETARRTSSTRGGEAGTFSVESAVFTGYGLVSLPPDPVWWRAVWCLQKGSSTGFGTSAHWVNLFCTSQTACLEVQEHGPLGDGGL